MSIHVKGYAICALTIASGRVVANLLVRILWVLPLSFVGFGTEERVIPKYVMLFFALE